MAGITLNMSIWLHVLQYKCTTLLIPLVSVKGVCNFVWSVLTSRLAILPNGCWMRKSHCWGCHSAHIAVSSWQHMLCSLDCLYMVWLQEPDWKPCSGSYSNCIYLSGVQLIQMFSCLMYFHVWLIKLETLIILYVSPQRCVHCMGKPV